MTEEVLQKLEYAFSMGCTDKEACLYADIAPTTLYNYQLDHPEFTERKDQLKDNPILKARTTVFDSLDVPQTAQWYLERKKKDEFSPRVENTGADGKDLIPVPILGNLNVHPHDSDNQDSSAEETHQSNSRRDISEQNDLNTPAADPRSTDGQDPNPN